MHYQYRLEDGAFIPAQRKGNEVIYLVTLTKAGNPLRGEEVESHFEDEASKKINTPFGTLSAELPMQVPQHQPFTKLALGGVIMLKGPISDGGMRAIASPIKTNIKLKATYAFNVRAFSIRLA